MKITSCRFERAVYRAADEPRSQDPVVAFLGRSNVGKSSLINRLLGARSLAKTSSQPGRTQSVNFYRVNDALYFVDLPGYGFARAPVSVRQSWGPMVEGFLDRHRERIALALLLLDARRGTGELDRVMRDWIESRELGYAVVATKSDKLSTSARRRAQRALLADWQGTAAKTVVMASSKTGSGTRELWRTLDLALAPEADAPGRATRRGTGGHR